MKGISKPTQKIIFCLSAMGLMLFGGFPIDLLFPARAEEIPIPEEMVHKLDFGIKKTKDGSFRANTDEYTVKFPEKLVNESSKIVTSDGYTLTAEILDLECRKFTGQENGLWTYESSKEVKPEVDGVSIVYPDVYTNISLKYDVCVDQCKETFVIKQMPGDILHDLIFNTKIKYNTSQLHIYMNGKKTDGSFGGTGSDLELQDDDGNVVYRIPKPVVWDTPEQGIEPNNGTTVNKSSTVDHIDCNYIVKPSGDGIRISYYVPYDYLTDPDTRYPVYLDPSLSPTSIYDSITYEGWFNNTIKRTDSSGVTYLPGIVLDLYSDLYIGTGGTLTLNNVTLRVVCDLCDGQYGIYVNSGGCLNVVNGSRVMSHPTWNYCYRMVYYTGSSGVIDEANIQDVDDTDNGLKIESDITIMNSNITGCKSSGIYIFGGCPTICNNKILGPGGLGDGIYVGPGSSPKIFGNDISYFGNSIYWGGNLYDETLSSELYVEELLNIELDNGELVPTSDNLLTYSFNYNDGGFEEVDDQQYSDNYWMSGGMFFHSDRRDPSDTHERLEKNLPYSITDDEDWYVNTSFELTCRYYNMGPNIAPSVSPLNLSSPDGTRNVYIECYGGNNINMFKDIIYVKVDDTPIVTYNTLQGTYGYYSDEYSVNISYNTTNNRIYGKICDGNDPSIVYASGNATYSDYKLENICLGRANGTGTTYGVYYEGQVDETRIYFGDIDFNVYTSAPVDIDTTNLFDSIHLEKTTTSDCDFTIDILDGATNELIPGLDNLSGETIDISGINSISEGSGGTGLGGGVSIKVRGRFVGNTSAEASVDSWTVYYRAADKSGWEGEDEVGAFHSGTIATDNRIVIGCSGYSNGNMTDDFDFDFYLDDMWEEVYHGGATTSSVDVMDSELYPMTYGVGTNWYGPGIKANVTAADGSFIFESELETLGGGFNSMGFLSISLLNSTNETLYEFNWSDSWASGISKIDLNDSGGILYSSGASSRFNQFEGQIKIERLRNHGVKFYMDEGEGYEEIHLTGTPGTTSLNGQVTSVLVLFGRQMMYISIPFYVDSLSFQSNFITSGSYTTGPIEPGSHCLWDSIMMDKTEPDRNHYITATVKDGITNTSISGYSDLKGTVIDISGIKVSEHPLLRIKFDFSGNNTTTPVLEDWQTNSIGMVYDNEISNSTKGIYCYRSRPTVAYNEIQYCTQGLYYYESPMLAIASMDYQESYEVSFIDHFLSHGKLSNWSNVEIINGRATLETGETSGFVESENITVPDSSMWYGLSIESNVPDNCNAAISVLDSDTGNPISGFSGLTDTEIFLTNIDYTTYSNIRLKATLSGNGSAYPSIIEWRIKTKLVHEFNDTFTDAGNITGGYNVVLDSGDIRLDNRTWWNNLYKYRRNISLSEELGINRTDEYHDLQINFSEWDHKPNCTDEIRIVYSNGTEADREITNFTWNQSVNFTFLIENITPNDDSYFFMYYGCDNPATPSAVDYTQTVVLLDENSTVSDLGDGWGPTNVANGSISMVDGDDGVTPPIGNYSAKLFGDDTSSGEDSSWYAEFNNDSITIPSGSFLGYYIYWVNTTNISSKSGGLDGNYTGGGSMGEGSPVAYDQNNIEFNPDSDISLNASNTWYYRYTDDLGGETIDSWFLAYNDTSNSEFGNFTLYFDYVFFGPNRGPLNTTIGDEETRYYLYGYVISDSIGDLPDNARWGSIRANTTIAENQSIYYEVWDSDTDTAISGYSYLTGDLISISGIDPVLYPNIQLVAILETNGSGTPLLHGWSVDWHRSFYSGMTVGNYIHNNYYGIQCIDSSPLIIDNVISYNEPRGIHVSTTKVDTMETTHVQDTIYRELFFDYSGTYESDFITVPNWASVTNVEMKIQGEQYIPEYDLSTSYTYQGWVNDSKDEEAVNCTLSMDKPSTWYNEYSYVYYENLSENGSPVNATVVNLSAWHNSTNLTFTNTSSSVLFNESITLDSEDPLTVEITTSNSNVKGNFSARTYVENVTEVTWTETDYGFSALVYLFQPDANVSEPNLVLYVPQGGFAELSACIVETDTDISSNFSINTQESGYISLDLTELSDIGDIWKSTDPQRSIRVNLSYYTKSPQIDIGVDGDYEWSWSGEFNTTINISTNDLIDGYNEHIGTDFYETTDISIRASVASASHLNITGIRVEWEYRPTIAYNDLHHCTIGVYTQLTSHLRIMDNNVYSNTNGVYIKTSEDASNTVNTISNGLNNITVSLKGNSNNTAYLRLPKGIYVTNASFDLTGSRYIPGIENDEQGYEYLGVCDNYTSLTLNDTFWATRPENWNVTSLEITAESLTREAGDCLAVWSVNGTDIDHSRWNGTEWINGTGTSITGINWIESAYKPGYVEQIILMLDSSGNLKARNWNGSGWPGSIDTLTSSASDPDILCFDVIYQESSLFPLAVYSNNSEKILFKEYDGSDWEEVANYSIENANWIKAIGIPGSDEAIILAANGTSYLTALFWNGSGIEYNWNLTDNLSNTSSPCFGLGREYYTNDIIAAWGNGSEEVVLASFNGTGWTNESQLDITGVNRIEAAWSENDDEITFLAGNETGNLTAIIWNGSGVENVTNMTDSLTSTTNGSFDVVMSPFSGHPIAVWANNSNAIEWRYYNGTNWSTKASRSAGEIRWVGGTSNYDQFEAIFMTLDASSDLKAYRWNGSNFNTSVLTLEGYASTYDHRCFDIVYEDPTIPAVPSHLNMTADYNGTVNAFSDGSNSVSFYSSDLDSENAYMFHINRTLNEAVSGYFSSDIRVYNATDKNWTRVHNGYYMTVPIWAPSVNVSQPQLKLQIPNGYYADIYVNITGTNRSVYRDYIHDEAKEYNFITIDLTNITEIGNIWNANDTNVTLNITLIYYCMNPSLDVGGDGDSEWFYQGNFNTTEEINESMHRLVKEINTLIEKAGVGEENITFNLYCPVAGNISISNLSLEYEYHTQVYNNDLTSNTFSANVEANATISANSITDSSKGIYATSGAAYITENTFGENYHGLYIYNSEPYVYDNTFTDGDGCTGIMSFYNDAVIEGNNITGYETGARVGSTVITDKVNVLVSNTFSENEIGIHALYYGVEIRNNEIRDSEDMGIHCDNYQGDIQYNELSNNTIGIYCEYNDETTVNVTGNSFIGNDKGIYCVSNSTVNIEECDFTANEQSLFAHWSRNVSLSGCSFSYNTIGVQLWESEFGIDNCTFSGNDIDYKTTAGANLSVVDCDYAYSRGHVNWSYTEDILNETFDVEDMKIGDVNNDTYNDIVVLNVSYKEGSLYYHNLSIFLYNAITDEFDEPIVKHLYNGSNDDRHLKIANIDSDDECEILVAYDNVTILDWNGIDWIEPAYSPIDSGSTHIDVSTGDVNNDSCIDIVTLTDICTAGAAVFYWNSTSNDFDSAENHSTSGSNSKLYVEDINDDDLDDIVVKYSGTCDHISIFNQTATGFDTRYDMEFDHNIVGEGMIIDDINDDNKNDILLEIHRSAPYEGYYFAYRLWNSSSLDFADDEILNSSVSCCYSDLCYFDTEQDGNNELIATSATGGDGIDVFNITDLSIEKTYTISDTLTEPSNIEYGLLNDDPYVDIVCFGYEPGGSVLYWNSSMSYTYRNVVVDVRNDTDVGVFNASVVIFDKGGTEIVNCTTNLTGITPMRRIRLQEKEIESQDHYGPYKVRISKLTGGTWYNVTRFFNTTTDNSIYALTKYIGNDSDNDGLTDGEEVYVIGSNSSDNDTDGDSILDGTEYGINDTTKASTTGVGFVADEDTDSITSLLVNDTDMDGLLDGEEDTDYNGKVDTGETIPIMWDSDGDWISDGDEVNYYLTDPMDADSDDDGSDDGKEIMAEYDPLDSGSVAPITDSDGDGLTNAIETLWGTDPNKPDTDGDGRYDGWLDSDGNGVYDLTELGEMPYEGWWEAQTGDNWWESGRGSSPMSIDTDNDGLDDSIEDPKGPNNEQLIWWNEAEDCSLIMSSAESDGDSLGDSCVLFNRFGDILQKQITGTFNEEYIKLGLRLKGSSNVNDPNMEITVCLPGHRIIIRIPSEYKYIETPWFEVRSLNNPRFTLIDTSMRNYNHEIYIDTIYLLRQSNSEWPIYSSQYTNLNYQDTDLDGRNDNLEVTKSGSHSKLWWYEAEDYACEDVNTEWKEWASNGRITTYNRNPMPGGGRSTVTGLNNDIDNEVRHFWSEDIGYYWSEDNGVTDADSGMATEGDGNMVPGSDKKTIMEFPWHGVQKDKYYRLIIRAKSNDMGYVSCSIKDTSDNLVGTERNSGKIDNANIDLYYFVFKVEGYGYYDELKVQIDYKYKFSGNVKVDNVIIIKGNCPLNSLGFYTISPPRNEDMDGDGLADDQEYDGKTSCINQDTDGDGVYEGFIGGGGEIYEDANHILSATNPDSDGDELWDGHFTKPRWLGYRIWELGYTEINRNGLDHQYCWLDYMGKGEMNSDTLNSNEDTDGDLVPDGLEVFYGFDPTIDDCSKYSEKSGDYNNVKNVQGIGDNTFINWMRKYLVNDFFKGDEQYSDHYTHTWDRVNKGENHDTLEYDASSVRWREVYLLESYIKMYQASCDCGEPKNRFLQRAEKHLNDLITAKTVLTPLNGESEIKEQGYLASTMGQDYYTRMIVYDTGICNVLLDYIKWDPKQEYINYIQSIFNFWEEEKETFNDGVTHAWFDKSSQSDHINDEGSYSVWWQPDNNRFGNCENGQFTKSTGHRYGYDVFNQYLPMGIMEMRMIRINHQYNGAVFSFTKATGGNGQSRYYEEWWMFKYRIKPMVEYFTNDWFDGPFGTRIWHYRRDTENYDSEDISHGGIDLQFLYDYDDFIDKCRPSGVGWSMNFNLQKDVFDKNILQKDKFGDPKWDMDHTIFLLNYQMNGSDSLSSTSTSNLYLDNWCVLSTDIMTKTKENFFLPLHDTGTPLNYKNYGYVNLMLSHIIKNININQIKTT